MNWSDDDDPEAIDAIATTMERRCTDDAIAVLIVCDPQKNNVTYRWAPLHAVRTLLHSGEDVRHMMVDPVWHLQWSLLPEFECPAGKRIQKIVTVFLDTADESVSSNEPHQFL